MIKSPQSKRELIMALVERLSNENTDDAELIQKQLDVIDNVVCEALDINKSENPSYCL